MAMDLCLFFKKNRKAALAFSGGVDSAYLLYAALTCGAQVRAYYVKSDFQPEFELEDAIKMAEFLHADIKILTLDVLKAPHVAENPQDRCYYCKKAIFSAITQAAREDGFSLLLDGTNASDEWDDRPGMRALQELSVRSPLRECGLTKSQIRSLSKEAGLFTWNKPAYACLATRIPAGTQITKESLHRTEVCESFLFSLGFSNFRIRLEGENAKLQVAEKDWQRVTEKREEILGELKKYYRSVLLDLEVRQ